MLAQLQHYAAECDCNPDQLNHCTRSHRDSFGSEYSRSHAADG